MPLEWSETNLAEGLAAYPLKSLSQIEAFFKLCQTQNRDVARVFLHWQGLTEYVQAWSPSAGAWLVLAVVRMVFEILEAYPDDDFPAVGGDPTQEMVLIVPLAHEQTIVHRIWTGYQELFHILSRTQRKSSARIWHRQASIRFFPELIIEIEDNEDANIPQTRSDEADDES
jgi:hypothetical protein